jgi:hypothetical protein
LINLKDALYKQILIEYGSIAQFFTVELSDQLLQCRRVKHLLVFRHFETETSLPDCLSVHVARPALLPSPDIAMLSCAPFTP